MRCELPVLVVSDNPDHASLVESSVGPPVLMSNSQDAFEILNTRPLAGMLVFVGGRGPVRSSRELLAQYLRCQPMGRVALLSTSSNATIGTQFVILPERVDVFFAPWDIDAVRDYLRLAPEAVAAR